MPGAQRTAGSRESEDDMEHGHDRRGHHEQRRDAHRTRVQPRGSARCNRPWYRSIATGTAMLIACSSSSTRSATALASMTPRKGISTVASANPYRVSGMGAGSARRATIAAGIGQKDQQPFVEQGRRVGRQPPQRHQSDEQRCGNRSAIGAPRRPAPCGPRVKSQPVSASTPTNNAARSAPLARR